MAAVSEEVMRAVRRIQDAKLALMQTQPFYAILLLRMKFLLDTACVTAYTDGERIAFNPDFLESLSDSELQFVLMHEVLHVALGHIFRYKKEYDSVLFNVACDIVINSNIMYSRGGNPKSISVNGEESMHLTPDGQEGYLFTAEQVYELFKKQSGNCKGGNGDGDGGGGDDTAGNGKDEGKGQGGASKGKSSGTGKNSTDGDMSNFTDDHSHWPSVKDKDKGEGWDERELEWQMACVSAEQISIKMSSKSRGAVPAGMERMLEDMRKPQTDWRTVLSEFIQEEVNDYSFSPPDRRFDDSPFFLPDFNEKDERVKNVLFFIDTSGSMSDADINAVYSEICGAIEQFGGLLEGWLGFFDAAATKPEPFSDSEELKLIRAYGGGGTSFHVIFKCVEDYMLGEQRIDASDISSIVILTDGYAPFPDEEDAHGIPVLWLLTTADVNPPWGKVTRIEV